jgi:hypothetical protein
LIGFKTQLGGGSLYSDRAKLLYDHIIYRASDKTHLYWAFGS